MKEKNIKWGILFLMGIFLIPNRVFAFDKKETIYTNLQVNGSVSHVNVVNHLSQLESGKVDDETRLKEILNINGKEKFTLKDGNLIWDAKGDDIFYKGEGSKELPISTNISYFLNGKQMDAKDMIGKKGKVKIVYSFTNLEKHNMYISGKNKTLYTPFVVTLGTILENNKNNSISITNGKIVNTGTKSMLIAIASPGLYESTSYDTFQNMDTITIEYETKAFKLGNVYLVATPKLLEENDFSIFHKMDSLYDKMDILQDSMNEIHAGVQRLVDGSFQIYMGAEEINQNLGKVSSVMNDLQAGSISLNNGLKEVISALQNVQGAIYNQNIAGSIQGLTALKAENEKAISRILTQSSQSFESLTSLYTANNLKEYTGTDASLLAIKSSYEMIFLLMQNNSAISNTISSMSSLSSQIEVLLSTLNDSFYKLENGSSSLSNGISQLKIGVNQLYDGSNALVNGTRDLHNGSNTLLNGTNAFNKDGIGTLMFTVNKAKEFSTIAKRLKELSDEYKGFSSSNSNTTLFVYMVDSLQS